jgi:hypothetical protein
MRALIVLLWRAELRINEALTISEHDLEPPSAIGREWHAPRQRLHLRGLATATEMQPDDHHATLVWVAALSATARSPSSVTASRGLFLLTAATSHDR